MVSPSYEEEDFTMTCSAVPSYKPFSHLTRPREVIRQFTPNWFAATMGTGVLALALAQLPVALPGMHALAETLWLFTIVLFIVFSGLYAARCGSRCRWISRYGPWAVFICPWRRH